MRTITNGHFKNGWDLLRGAKWRNFWTMLGVIIGVSSVISIVGIGEGIKQQVGGQIHQFGKDLIIVRPSQIGSNGKTIDGLNSLSGISITTMLSSKDFESIKKITTVASVAPLSAVLGTVHGEHGVYNDGLVIGTTPDLPHLLNQSLDSGVFLTEEDAGIPAAVLGKHAAEKLFDESVPLGRSFEFHGQQFIVRGVFNEFTAAPLSEQAGFNNAIFIPYDMSLLLTKNSAPTYEIFAKATNLKLSSKTISSINKELLANHGGQADFTILQQNQNLVASNSIVDLLTKMIAIVAAISLLVGGVGIMNVMLVSVSERLHEIGIRKAVGATNRQILNQFLIEATLLSFVGGTIGIIIAAIANVVIRLTTDLRPILNWQIVLIAAGVSLVTGILFGSIPALKAARKDPIKALRAD